MKKILLIEDDVVLRESTAELLEIIADYKIVTASNGRLGIHKALIELPDLIICDVMMPEVDGYGVLERLSKDSRAKFIPFIFLSARTERNDIRKGMNLGADDYITKPFREDELVSAIESRLAKASILKELRDVEEATIKKEKEELNNINDLKNFLDDNGTNYTYETNEKIYEEGDESKYIFLVNKGSVKCQKFNDYGKILTTSIYKEDDLFGYTSFLKDQAYQETSIAIEPTELVRIAKSELINVLQNNHKVVLDLVDLLNENLITVKEQLLDMAYDSVHKKTATTLLKFAEKINKKSNDLIKVSRHDLATIAGISTETLIRSISKFKKQGILDIEGRNIKILDLEALKLIE